jgi:hypothetical protein
VAEAFARLFGGLEDSTERDDAVHEVAEITWNGPIETGREMAAAFFES